MPKPLDPIPAAYVDKPVYWHLPDDGAAYRCTSCHAQFPHTQVLLTKVPAKTYKETICLDCLDPDWLAMAHDLGQLTL